MIFEAAAKQALDQARLQYFPEVSAVYVSDITRVTDSCFVVIFPGDIETKDNGENPASCNTQPLEIGVIQKVLEKPLSQVIAECDSTGLKVQTCLENNKRLVSTLHPSGFLVKAGKIGKIERGNTRHDNANCRYYKFNFEGYYFGELI